MLGGLIVICTSAGAFQDATSKNTPAVDDATGLLRTILGQ
jgi:hypothetical protein